MSARATLAGRCRQWARRSDAWERDHPIAAGFLGAACLLAFWTAAAVWILAIGGGA